MPKSNTDLTLKKKWSFTEGQNLEQVGDFQIEGPAGSEHETDRVWRKKTRDWLGCPWGKMKENTEKGSGGHGPLGTRALDA